TIGEMVKKLENDTGWNKATVNSMLSRLAENGAVNVDPSGRSKLFYPVLKRDEAVKREAENTLAKIKTGGLGLLISTRAKSCDLSEEEIDDLYKTLKEGSGKK
ncbi:MAG: BlaI/MecI/CopY family transcriptional regulator, partial [Clostridia bacterium]|nr:BlaI/MecI/CopY family transcriptional regulator [Clostridia bacterium]